MIFISTNHSHLRVANKYIYNTLRYVYEGEKKKIPALAVILTYNRFMKEINREFLGHNLVTDVIAFPSGENDGVESEIYINLDAARRQAREYNVKFTEEFKRLLIHGTLHLLGYRDKTMKQKRIMNTRENMYLTLMSLKERAQ